MQIDTERNEPGASFDSSPKQSRLSLGRSTKPSAGKPPVEPEKDDGDSPESKQMLCDWLLSQLQAITGDLRDAGIETHLYVGNATLTITLADVRICQGTDGNHPPIFHSGKKCPLCQEKT
ncbi:MAG: hypothetical protein ACRDGM_04270 [bacterium]